MEDITKDKDNIILLVIIAALVGWNIFTTNSIKTDVKGYEKKIENIGVKIDSSNVVNKNINDKVSEVKENVEIFRSNNLFVFLFFQDCIYSK